jgi:hypothetical protein
LLVLEQGDMSVQTKILIGAVLLVDGRLHTSTLEMMQEEAATNLVIRTLWEDRFNNVRLHRIFLELLYEMCRIQKINFRDLGKISMEFLEFLFSVVQNNEGYDSTDPYNLAAMKVLLALNEQYMIASLGRKPDMLEEEEVTASIENRTFGVLKSAGNRFRAFGENLVFLFNRGADKCLQLMMMKFLYLIFTTKQTYQYIYLNDLKVLVGVIVRELYDLPKEEETLRNTYLRILHPLLQNTQLRQEEYKREELVGLLDGMSNPAHGGQIVLTETTQRLAYRCLKVDWLNYSSPLMSPVDSETEIDNFILTPQSSNLPPPRPNPRKMLDMRVRHDSAIEIATLKKGSPPPPPRSPFRRPHSNPILRSSAALTPPPPPPPRMRVTTPINM